MDSSHYYGTNPFAEMANPFMEMANPFTEMANPSTTGSKPFAATAQSSNLGEKGGSSDPPVVQA